MNVVTLVVVSVIAHSGRTSWERLGWVLATWSKRREEKNTGAGEVFALMGEDLRGKCGMLGRVEV